MHSRYIQNINIEFMHVRLYSWCNLLLGEAVQNASGLGLQYVNGNPQWDATTNVNILKLDVSLCTWLIINLSFTKQE